MATNTKVMFIKLFILFAVVYSYNEFMKLLEFIFLFLSWCE